MKGSRHRTASFVGPEEREPVVQEICQGGDGFASGDRETALSVVSEEADSVGLPLVKLLPHTRIDVVFLGLPGWWEREVGFTLGWWEAIVVVEVPLSALRAFRRS